MPRSSRGWSQYAPLAILAIVLAVAVADLVTKAVMTRWLGPSSSMREWWLVEEWIGFQFGRNTGAAFGLFRGNAELLAAVSVVVAVAVGWLAWTEVTSPVVRVVSIGLIVGGGLGNLVERIAQGYVTDFLALGPWPRFNVADSAVTIGVAILIGAMVLEPRPAPDSRAVHNRHHHTETATHERQGDPYE